MTTPDVKQIILDLSRWYPTMVEASTHTLQAVKASHAHTTGLQADSQPERSAFAADRLHREMAELAELASIHAASTILDTQHSLIINVLNQHAATIRAWPEHRTIIEQIHARWQQACEPSEEQSDWLCPSCGTAQLRWRHAQRLYVCPACEYAGTAENVANMRRYVITQADVWISKRQAIELFGFRSRQSLDHHIHAGALEVRDGKVNTAQLRDLNRNTC